MHKFIVPVSIILSLGGCGGYGAYESSTPVSRCNDYGYEQGTKDFRDCVADESRNDRAIAQQARDARRARIQRLNRQNGLCTGSLYC